MVTRPDPTPELMAFDRKTRQTIKDHGWAGVGIYDVPNEPGYTYSVGIWKTARRPEVIIFGLSLNRATSCIWALYRKMKNKPRLPFGVEIDGVLKDYPIYLMPVSVARYPGLISYARAFHMGDFFPCVQIILPDANRRFPWDAGCNPVFVRGQPDLSDKGWDEELKNAAAADDAEDGQ